MNGNGRGYYGTAEMLATHLRSTAGHVSGSPSEYWQGRDLRVAAGKLAAVLTTTLKLPPDVAATTPAEKACARVVYALEDVRDEINRGLPEVGNMRHRGHLLVARAAGAMAGVMELARDHGKAEVDVSEVLAGVLAAATESVTSAPPEALATARDRAEELARVLDKALTALPRQEPES